MLFASSVFTGWAATFKVRGVAHGAGHRHGEPRRHIAEIAPHTAGRLVTLTNYHSHRHPRGPTLNMVIAQSPDDATPLMIELMERHGWRWMFTLVAPSALFFWRVDVPKSALVGEERPERPAHRVLPHRGRGLCRCRVG
jgi:hypothetical protein